MPLRLTALALGLIAVVATWYMLGSGADVSLLGLFALTVYTFAPWAYLASGGKSLTESARGVALGLVVILAAATYGSAASSDSSTEALVYLFVPLYQWAAVGAVSLFSSVRAAKNRR